MGQKTALRPTTGTSTGEKMIFIDTSAFYAMEVKVDTNHEKAIKVKEEMAQNRHGVPFTTNYVISETITLLRFKAGHDAAVAFGNKIMSSKALNVIRADDELDASALRLFAKYEDKNLSFADAASFVVMQKLGIDKAFAFDEHFSQMGFELVG